MRPKRQPLLAIDIGNSTIGLGFFIDPNIGKGLTVEKIPLSHIKSSATLSRMIINLLAKCYKTSNLPKQRIGVVISSVVPELTRYATEAVKSLCTDPVIITHTLATGLTLKVSNSKTLGSDRIVNGLAGFRHFGKPIAVVDVGTATTITVVNKNSTLIGGAIMPGINLMRESLASNTAKLPLIPLQKPSSMLGTDTESALVSGIINGTVGAVENIVRGIEEETHMKLKLILTGGQAGLIASVLKREHVVIPDLIFEGMRLIYNLHKEN